MAQIFISYSRKDTTFAKRLDESLSNFGFKIWIDLAGISAGSKWSQAIQEALDETSIMIVIISPESMASPNVMDEWQYFLDQKKPIIPVLLEPAKIHFQLNRIQYIDFRTKNYDFALKQLVKEISLKQILPTPATNKPLAHPTPKPASWLKRLLFQGIFVITLLVLGIGILLYQQQARSTPEQVITTQPSETQPSQPTVSTLSFGTPTNNQETTPASGQPAIIPSTTSDTADLSGGSAIMTTIPETTPTTGFTIRVKIGYANLRSGPGANFPSVATAIEGETYAALGQAQGIGTNGKSVAWYLIMYWNGQKLWITSEVVDEFNPTNNVPGMTPTHPPPPPTVPGGGCVDSCG